MLVSPTINSLHGRIRSITGTDPPANTEIIEVIPARRRWLIHGFFFALTTDANPADRQVTVIIDDGTNLLFQLIVATVQTASLNWNYSMVLSSALEIQSGTSLIHPFPKIPLVAGYRIRTVTINKQVTDNYGPPQLLIEEWIDP